MEIDSKEKKVKPTKTKTENHPKEDKEIQTTGENKTKRKKVRKIRRIRRIKMTPRQEDPLTSNSKANDIPTHEITVACEELDSFLEEIDDEKSDDIPTHEITVAYEELDSFLEEIDDEETNETQNTVANFAQEIRHSEAEASIQELVVKGREYLQTKNFKEALKCINKALGIDPQEGDAWSAKGDVFLEMGKIDDATSCYKKAMVTSFGTGEGELDNELSRELNETDDFNDAFMSMLAEEKSQLIEENDKIFFECPNCGSIVDLKEKLCPGCNTIFLEEEFTSDLNSIDADLVFFDKLKKIFTVEKPIFVHLDGESGFLSFIDKRKNPLTGKVDYVLIKAYIEKISWDYSLGGEDASELIEVRRSE